MTINDREWKFLAEQTGLSLPFNDMYYRYLRGLGYTGTLQDMIAKYGYGFTPSKGGSLIYVRAVSNRLLAAPTSLDNTRTDDAAYTWHKLFDEVSGRLDIWYPHFYTGNGGGAVGGGCSDRAIGAAGTGRGFVTYADKDSGQVVTVDMLNSDDNSTSLSAPDGGWFKTYAEINAAEGSTIYCHFVRHCSAGIVNSLARSDPDRGDRYEFGTSPIPTNRLPISSFPSYRTYYGPMLIAAPTEKPVVGIIGTSREVSLTDVVTDVTGNIGTMGRLFSSIAQVNLSGSGDKAQSFAANDIHSARRRELAPFATFVALAENINDFGTRTAEQVELDNTSIASQVNLPAIWVTSNPFTIGDYTTPNSSEARRVAYNTLVRSKNMYVDPAGVMEVSNSGAWNCEDAVAPETNRIHETAAGNSYAAIHCAIVGTTLEEHGLAPRPAGPVMPSLGTNLFTQGRNFNHSYWTKNNSTIITNLRDPECKSSAQGLREAATTISHDIAVGPVALDNLAGTWEMTWDLAYSGRQWLLMQLFNQDFSKQANRWIDVQNGALGNTFNSDAANLAFTSVTVIPISMDYYRFKFTITKGASVTSVWPILAVAPSNGGDKNSVVGNTNLGYNLRPHARLRKIS